MIDVSHLQTYGASFDLLTVTAVCLHLVRCRGCLQAIAAAVTVSP